MNRNPPCLKNNKDHPEFGLIHWAKWLWLNGAMVKQKSCQCFTIPTVDGSDQQASHWSSVQPPCWLMMIWGSTMLYFHILSNFHYGPTYWRLSSTMGTSQPTSVTDALRSCFKPPAKCSGRAIDPVAIDLLRRPGQWLQGLSKVGGVGLSKVQHIYI